MKRIITFMMAMLMIAVLCIPAFAAGTGSITITNAAIGETYNIYEMATLNSYSGSSYSYTVVNQWADFFNNNEIAKDYFTVTAEGSYLIDENRATAAQMAEIAKAALEYAETNNITPTKSGKAEATSLQFTGLDMGYYLIDTSLGTLCSVKTATENVTVTDKNSAPTVIKKVLEDSNTDIEWERENDADLFQAIQFKSEINVGNGAEKYILHDKMENMDFDIDSVYIYTSKPTSIGQTEGLVPDESYSLETDSLNDGCTFHIVFKESFCKTLAANSTIFVYYQASLNENANVGSSKGNDNKTWLVYGDAQTTESSSTTTKTYKFEMVKTDNAGKYLEHAKFTLWRDETSTDESAKIGLIAVGTDGHTYRIAEIGETGAVYEFELTNGKALSIEGLDGETTYYLEETDAPEGYNQIVGRTPLPNKLDEVELVLTESGKSAETYEKSYGGVQIINRTGTQLPETGGMGTKMFILIGSLLVLISGVLLATKLRMSKMRG